MVELSHGSLAFTILGIFWAHLGSIPDAKTAMNGGLTSDANLKCPRTTVLAAPVGKTGPVGTPVSFLLTYLSRCFKPGPCISNYSTQSLKPLKNNP